MNIDIARRVAGLSLVVVGLSGLAACYLQVRKIEEISASFKEKSDQRLTILRQMSEELNQIGNNGPLKDDPHWLEYQRLSEELDKIR